MKNIKNQALTLVKSRKKTFNQCFNAKNSDLYYENLFIKCQ